MFEQTFVNTASPASKAGTMTVSLALQYIAVLIAIIVSVARTQTLPDLQLKTRLIAPPPPAPVHQLKPTMSSESFVRRPRFVFTFPLFAAARPARTHTDEVPGPPPDFVGSSAGVGADSGVIYSIAVGTDRPVPPPQLAQPNPTAPKTGPERVSEGVAEANLIQKVVPQYPRLAIQARIQGTVRFRAVIGTDGRIQDLQLVAGPPLLIKAAEDSVLLWRYRPTLLNGMPVPVITDISVNFRLDDRR
jgi:protein TonB